MNKTGVHGEVTVVQQHRAGDAVGQQIERQLVFGIGAPWSPAAKKAKRTFHDGWLRSKPTSPRTGGAPVVRVERLITALTWKAPSSRAPSNTL